MNPTLTPRRITYFTDAEALASFESNDDFVYHLPGSLLDGKVCCREELRKFGIRRVNIRYRAGHTVKVDIIGRTKEEYQP